jgi:AcrR family transcriptional regulator
MAALPAAPRLTAEQRRQQLLEAAASEFAITGLHGTSTEAIARRAGISHAYLFRLFPTKKELFLACAQRCFERTRDTFRAAAAATPDPGERLAAIGRAYVEMLDDRELLRLQMQLYAACSDPDVRAVTRAGFDELVREVQALSGAAPEEVHAFFAHGMLLNVAAAMDAPDLGDLRSWSC